MLIYIAYHKHFSQYSGQLPQHPYSSKNITQFLFQLIHFNQLSDRNNDNIAVSVKHCRNNTLMAAIIVFFPCTKFESCIWGFWCARCRPFYGKGGGKGQERSREYYGSRPARRTLPTLWLPDEVGDFRKFVKRSFSWKLTPKIYVHSAESCIRYTNASSVLVLYSVQVLYKQKHWMAWIDIFW